MTASQGVTVIVPVLDAVRSLGGLLDALAAQLGVTCEVLVVDNRSRDGTAALAARHPVVTRVLTEPAPGSYAARNAGLAVATGDVLAFTDGDCVPEPSWLSEGLAALVDGVDLVGGAVVAAGSAHPTVWERYDRAVYLRQDELVAHDGFAATANLFVRREVFDAVGPFDPRLRSGGDYEFGRRATAAGFRLAYAPEARVSHRPRTGALSTWSVHRRIGAGWATLAAQGKRGPARRDPALRLSLGTVIDRAAADGVGLRRRQVAPVHALAMAARWTGRLTGRG